LFLLLLLGPVGAWMDGWCMERGMRVELASAGTIHTHPIWLVFIFCEFLAPLAGTLLLGFSHCSFSVPVPDGLFGSLEK
jgi:hypothetical protein